MMETHRIVNVLYSSFNSGLAVSINGQKLNINGAQSKQLNDNFLYHIGQNINYYSNVEIEVFFNEGPNFVNTSTGIYANFSIAKFVDFAKEETFGVPAILVMSIYDDPCKLGFTVPSGL